MSLEKSLKTFAGLTFEDLYEREGLVKLNQKFTEFLQEKNAAVAQQFFTLKQSQKTFSKRSESLILIDTARVFEDFLVELFGIQKENSELKKKHDDLQKIYHVRREFVQRDIAKKFNEASEDVDGIRLLKDLGISFDDVAELEKILVTEILAERNLELLISYARWALYSKEGRQLHKNGALFILPQKIDHQNLVKKPDEIINREGFDLTDKGFELNRSLAETHYCIFCHKQEKDSCRSGFTQPSSLAQSAEDLVKLELKLTGSSALRTKDDGLVGRSFKKDSLGVELHGCPLDEKISEMNLLKSEGLSIAALSVAVIDNAMIVGTGHRICNDCMKSCIYQKQDPVDIPQIETRISKDVLSLPYGFEIYSLLTRWNPLNIERTLPNEKTNKKILIAGLGPAGYTLAHHLLNDGHDVVAIDGLKIEPLNSEISGIDEFGNRKNFRAIKFLDEIYEPLSSRLIQGFGGVAEYGITVRWDKNFLKVIRLLLERRKNFRMFGGLRFGSSITDKIAFEDYGFDHVALCIGAGRPNIINLKNNFAKGIRSASDFLMSLQLSGAFKENLFTNLQIRMPVLVIGGGLTAVDTACEARVYYLTQIKKFAKRIAEIGKENFFKKLNAEEKIIAEEFLDHEEKRRVGNLDFLSVKILYRKKIQSSPAYRLNHQELNKAFEENIEFLEDITPLEAELDDFGHIKNLKCVGERNFKCGSLLIAAGTTPNLSPVLEDNLDLEIVGKYFASSYKESAQGFNFITKIDESSRKAVSFFGDLHPQFEGNVVKAMASSKVGHKQITEVLKTTRASSLVRSAEGREENDRRVENDDVFWNKINSEFLVKIEKVEMLSSHVVEVVVKAPLLANQTELGHIFRLQNYHAFAQKKGNQIAAMEGVPLTAIYVDRKRGLISVIAVLFGASTSLIKNFKAGEPCIFMGPSGKPTEIVANETVVLIGGGRGNLPLAAIARAFKDKGCRVIFFAGYREASEIVRQQDMKNSCDEMIFAIEANCAISGYYQGSVVEAVKNYFLKNPQKIDRIFTIGNDQMMHEIAKLRHENSVQSISDATYAITSLNAPMQCMMKGVCSQCLQKRKNEKGEDEYFYACASQDQNMDKLDFIHLHQRCEQNSLLEKLTKNLI